MKMPEGKSETAEYSRGYLDGIAAASDVVAAFFGAQEKRDARTVRELSTAQALMRQTMLVMLAPLQDDIRRLRPSEETVEHG